jgi:hypothetical protein
MVALTSVAEKPLRLQSNNRALPKTGAKYPLGSFRDLYIFDQSAEAADTSKRVTSGQPVVGGATSSGGGSKWDIG